MVLKTQKAEDLFHMAAGDLDGVDRAQAYMLAGVCCRMRDNEPGMRIYNKKALETAEQVIYDIMKRFSRKTRFFNYLANKLENVSETAGGVGAWFTMMSGMDDVLRNIKDPN